MPLPKDPKKAEETRRRMSESAKRRVRTPEFETKRKQAMGKPETRAKLSQSQQKRFTDPKAREVTSRTTKEAMARPEIKAKMHEVVQAQWDNPETRETLIASSHRRWERPEEHQKVSEATKAAMWRDDVRERYLAGLPVMQAQLQEMWTNPQYKSERVAKMVEWTRTPEALEKWAEAMSRVHRSRERTSIEVIIASLLDALGVEYEPQKRIGRYVADFYIPSKNLIIEVDGEYWHSERKPGSLEKDARKDAFLTSRGYTILRIPEQNIRKNDLSDFIKVIAS